MKHLAQRYKFREATHEGEVGAGRLLPFIPKGGISTVLIPDTMPENELLGTLTVRGNSLEDEGIFDGDLLICKKVYSKKQIARDSICIVYIPATGELVAKKIEFRANVLILRSCGGGFPEIHVSPNDVDIRGVVFSFQRVLNHRGTFRTAEEEIPF